MKLAKECTLSASGLFIWIATHFSPPGDSAPRNATSGAWRGEGSGHLTFPWPLLEDISIPETLAHTNVLQEFPVYDSVEPSHLSISPPMRPEKDTWSSLTCGIHLTSSWHRRDLCVFAASRCYFSRHAQSIRPDLGIVACTSPGDMVATTMICILG